MLSWVLNLDLFQVWFIFNYKWNKNIVVWEKNTWCYILDLEYDPEFNNAEVLFVSWWDLSEDLLSRDNLDLFIKEDFKD